MATTPSSNIKFKITMRLKCVKDILHRWALAQETLFN